MQKQLCCQIMHFVFLLLLMCFYCCVFALLDGFSWGFVFVFIFFSRYKRRQVPVSLFLSMCGQIFNPKHLFFFLSESSAHSHNNYKHWGVVKTELISNIPMLWKCTGTDLSTESILILTSFIKSHSLRDSTLLMENYLRTRTAPFSEHREAAIATYLYFPRWTKVFVQWIGKWRNSSFLHFPWEVKPKKKKGKTTTISHRSSKNKTV